MDDDDELDILIQEMEPSQRTPSSKRTAKQSEKLAGSGKASQNEDEEAEEEEYDEEEEEEQEEED